MKLIGPSDRALMRFKGRLERVEEEHRRRTTEALDRYLEGRSTEDVEFFCVHGYLPQIPIPGRPFESPPMSWNERWKDWKEFQTRFLEGLSYEQVEEIALDWRFPEPLPEPLPLGMSELDQLDRKSLVRRWEESECET